MADYEDLKNRIEALEPMQKAFFNTVSKYKIYRVDCPGICQADQDVANDLANEINALTLNEITDGLMPAMTENRQLSTRPC